MWYFQGQLFFEYYTFPPYMKRLLGALHSRITERHSGIFLYFNFWIESEAWRKFVCAKFAFYRRTFSLTRRFYQCYREFRCLIGRLRSFMLLFSSYTAITVCFYVRYSFFFIPRDHFRLCRSVIDFRIEFTTNSGISLRFSIISNKVYWKMMLWLIVDIPYTK